MQPRRVSARLGAMRVSAITKVGPRACTARAAELRGARPPRSAPAVVSRPLRRRWTPRRCAPSARAASPAIADKFVMAPVKSGLFCLSYAKSLNRPTSYFGLLTHQLDVSSTSRCNRKRIVGTATSSDNGRPHPPPYRRGQ